MPQNAAIAIICKMPIPGRSKTRLIPTLGADGVLTAYYGNPRQVFATFAAKF